MKRKKKHVGESETKSILAQRLERGEDIKGLTGYIPIDPSTGEGESDEGVDYRTVFVKVKCEGLVTGDSSSCSLKIECSLVAGIGKFSILPCQWLDKPTDVEYLLDLNKRKDRFRELVQKVWDVHNLVNKQQNIAAWITQHLSPQHQDKVWAGIQSKTGKEEKRDLSKVDLDTCRSVLREAVALSLNLTPSQIGEEARYNYT